MRRPVVSADSQDLLKNHLLARVCPTWGLPLGEVDYMRGWKDDFFGDQLKDEYSQVIGGAASDISLTNLAGGVVQLRCDNNINDTAILVLGNWLCVNYGGLDADEGWVMLWKAEIPTPSDLQATAGGYEATTSHFIYAGYRADVGGNWILSCDDGTGPTTVDSGIAADNGDHWHALDVYPTDTGHQVDYYVDGAEAATTTNDIPVNLLAPVLMNVNRVGTARRKFRVDYWAVIPRNLV